MSDKLKLICHKLLCCMWGHKYFVYYRLYVGMDKWTDERFKCKHCGAHKHDN